MGSFVIFIIRTGFYRKSDKICIGIILKQNFKLPAIFSVVTASGHKMKYA